MNSKFVLFVSLNFFDFSNINEKDFNKLKQNFLYNFHKKFNSFSTSSKNISDFLQKTLSKDNNKIFYRGLENEIKEKKKIKIKEIDNFYKQKLSSLSDTTKSSSEYLVKTKIGKNKTESLVSKLFIVQVKTIVGFKEETKWYFFLFPISFDDYH